MKIGEPFNPTRQACGFFPQDVVSRLPRLTILETRRKFSHGHKNIYALLVRLWAKNQECSPDYKWLAQAVGVSLRSVKMLAEDLEAFGVIQHAVRRGRQKGGRHLTNEYTFLWHSIFEVQNPPGVKCKQSHFEVQEPAGLKCKNRDTLYSEETHTETPVQHHRRGCEPEPRTGDDAVQTYQKQVLELLQRREGTPRKLSIDDQALCREWEHQGIPVETVRRAIVLGCLRKRAAAINSGTGPVRIGSLKYFAGVLAEAQDPASGPDYWVHLEQKLRRLEAGVGTSEAPGGDKTRFEHQGAEPRVHSAQLQTVEESASTIGPRPPQLELGTRAEVPSTVPVGASG